MLCTPAFQGFCRVAEFVVQDMEGVSIWPRTIPRLLHHRQVAIEFGPDSLKLKSLESMQHGDRGESQGSTI